MNTCGVNALAGHLSWRCLICNATLQSDIRSHDVAAVQSFKTGSFQSHQHVSEEDHVITFGTFKVKQRSKSIENRTSSCRGLRSPRQNSHQWLRHVAWCQRCTTQSVCHCWRWIYHASRVLTWKVCRQLKDLSFLNHGNHMLHSMLLSAHSEQYHRIVHWHTSNVYLTLTAVTTLY